MKKEKRSLYCTKRLKAQSVFIIVAIAVINFAHDFTVVGQAVNISETTNH